MNYIKDTYIQFRFFQLLGLNIAIFILAYSFGFLLYFSLFLLIVFIALVVLDFIFLYGNGSIESIRKIGTKLSNGDDNLIQLDIQNKYPFRIDCKVIDEIPFQFQRRDINWQIELEKGENKIFDYSLRPVKRGEYNFGKTNIFVSSPIGLISRRFQFEEESIIPVYPSFLNQKRYEFLAFGSKLKPVGNKKIRRIGQSREFEQIKNYIQGDDPRTVNWKASARMGHLMVNQYQEEKSQPIYALIDKGRLMKMPFENLSLLDYSINATLAFLSIALKSGDKVGLLTFADKASSFLKAQKRNSQLLKINEMLYNQKTLYKEPSYERLNSVVFRNIKQRSLLILFTNFESFEGYKLRLKFLKNLSKKHLLVVVFYKNTEVESLINEEATSIKDIYYQTIAEKYIHDKKLIVKDLRAHGIISILGAPENISVETINKYLVIKESGLL